MNYLVAVSGGVDSVVLLHMLARQELDFLKSKDEIAVAHFNHGIRDDAEDDAGFAEGLAKKYGFEFVLGKAKLGKKASEEEARIARYEFLFKEAKKRKSIILTAHHKDDLVETIALNLTRGTGWRGLAVLAREGIERPLLGMTKKEIYDYSLLHRLEWTEDSTNQTLDYTRNRLRHKTTGLAAGKQRKLVALRKSQLKLKEKIQKETEKLIKNQGTSRYFLTHIEEDAAVEVLGSLIEQTNGLRPVRPQLRRALIAVKTAKPGSTHHVGDRTKLVFSSRLFKIEVL